MHTFDQRVKDILEEQAAPGSDPRKIGVNNLASHMDVSQFKPLFRSPELIEWLHKANEFWQAAGRLEKAAANKQLLSVVKKIEHYIELYDIDIYDSNSFTRYGITQDDVDVYMQLEQLQRHNDFHDLLGVLSPLDVRSRN